MHSAEVAIGAAVKFTELSAGKVYLLVKGGQFPITWQHADKGRAKKVAKFFDALATATEKAALTSKDHDSTTKEQIIYNLEKVGMALLLHHHNKAFPDEKKKKKLKGALKISTIENMLKPPSSTCNGLGDIINTARFQAWRASYEGREEEAAAEAYLSPSVVDTYRHPVAAGVAGGEPPAKRPRGGPW